MQKLEQSLKELAAGLDGEVQSRQSLAEEVDQVLKAMKWGPSEPS